MKPTDQQTPPSPLAADAEDCWLLVMMDMRDRRNHGIAKYGQPVNPNNGRDQLVDAYQEALDLCVYLRSEILRREKEKQRAVQEVPGQ